MLKQFELFYCQISKMLIDSVIIAYYNYSVALCSVIVLNERC